MAALPHCPECRQLTQVGRGMFAPKNIPMLLLGLSQICGCEGECGSKAQGSPNWEEGEANPVPGCIN